MVPNPVSLAVDIQRNAIKRGRESIERSVAAQQRLGDTLVEGIESQGELQRELMEQQYVYFRELLKQADEDTPGQIVDHDVLARMDEQAAAVYSEHVDTVDAIASDVETGVDTVEGVSESSLQSVEHQLDVLAETLQEIESQIQTPIPNYEELS